MPPFARCWPRGRPLRIEPFSLRIEVGCDGLDCGDIPVLAKELRVDGPPVTLAEGTAHVVSGSATIELSLTIERAGTRVLEVSLRPPPEDSIAENEPAAAQIEVTRDRVRVLHVAGRPTYDVRALRMWLKGDTSVDLVAFYILRGPASQVQAIDEELALIPFPVQQLFTDQLPTFDAVVLQDFDSSPSVVPPYGLKRFLPDLARYVKEGGGLIMVGGPGASSAATTPAVTSRRCFPSSSTRTPSPRTLRGLLPS